MRIVEEVMTLLILSVVIHGLYFIFGFESMVITAIIVSLYLYGWR